MGTVTQDAAAAPSSADEDDGPTRPIGTGAGADADADASDHDPSVMQPGHVGETLGRYVLLRPLGAGGMSVVWVAYDPELDRRVALKLMHRVVDGSSFGDGDQRLLREAQALARL